MCDHRLMIVALSLSACVDHHLNGPAGRDVPRVTVSAGTYPLGCDGALVCKENPHRLVSIQSFQIDRLQSTWRDATACIAAKQCAAEEGVAMPSPEEGLELTYKQALAYCVGRGGRLATSDEWEVAARGHDERLYPWGNTLRYDLLPPLSLVPADSGASRGEYRPREIAGSESPFGLHGMVGGLAEWVKSDPQSPIARGGAGAGGVGFHDRDPYVFSTVRIRRLSAGDRAGVRCVFDR
jgi:formylglycine-generating enzyme required for sulfatase activity